MQKFHRAAASRRRALKVVSGSALMGGLMNQLPDIWQRPLVQAGALPAHAQTSSQMRSFTLRLLVGDTERTPLVIPTQVQMSNGRITEVRVNQTAQYPNAVADVLIPPAHAQSTGIFVAQPLVLFFGANLSARGMLKLADATGTCDYPIRARLTEDRGDLASFYGGWGDRPGQAFCGNIVFFPGAGFTNAATGSLSELQNTYVLTLRLVISGVSDVSLPLSAIIERADGRITELRIETITRNPQNAVLDFLMPVARAQIPVPGLQLVEPLRLLFSGSTSASGTFRLADLERNPCNYPIRADLTPDHRNLANIYGGYPDVAEGVSCGNVTFYPGQGFSNVVTGTLLPPRPTPAPPPPITLATPAPVVSTAIPTTAEATTTMEPTTTAKPTTSAPTTSVPPTTM